METAIANFCRNCGARLDSEYGSRYDLCVTCRENNVVLGAGNPPVAVNAGISSNPLDISIEQLKALMEMRKGIRAIKNILWFFVILTILGLISGIITVIALSASRW